MSNLVQGKTGDWEVVIGIEIHAQVTTQAKLFSGAPTTFGAEANSQVSLVDAAMPGMLPVINAEAVRQAVRTGLALNSKINRHSVFARKNYFYPDLPQGYQISQYEQPIVGEGEIEIDLEDGTTRAIGVERLHLEQDAGKSIHDQVPEKSLIDLNRAGVALMEIVSKPDIRSGDEASAYVGKVRSILRYIGSCDGNMQEGSMRADINISVRKPGDDLGTRAEVKNVNSLRFIRQAVEVEVKRQIRLIEGGGTVVQETRLFDPNKGETRSMRTKEDAHDYRYFPDPDLLPVVFGEDFVAECQATLPELPDVKKRRFVEELGLSPYDAGVLSAEREMAEYFEAASQACGDAKLASNWVTVELFGRLNKAGLGISDSKVSAQALGGLLTLIKDGSISGKIAKDVFDEMFETGGDAAEIVESKGLKQISDTGALEAIIDTLIAENPSQVEGYRGGNVKLIGWFVGQVMKQTQGQANPGMVNQLLKAKLDN
ncbi:MAG TPA: Asp-tRNA(Asn)/Glu-tRNA(Gln) amidotransferase GatCAB subunit B [Rhodospirillaceae bacterium]|nr:Asp-tRNA(Asn)/Glu-tRNA(Gln) amidotransferase GatCAB subunit B [Rhodospirillaceae bacterium]MBB58087.1 Asp-tRNA(Asn)/Glu-tRNA(Gln) amidotransferase GatCAB subunit B [Rhodospirillaceae bacterium]HAJ19636.1 Asp-tRNA(Asn)/Glu-tRNA(Gln) amidotransferase GatCAB subunit B [Rhodospirillaceae bacterium]|tara:strand:+ start:83137 stop:84594 length:1458 start_codon:yes stop_codon:yes gene_type:complete